MQSTSPIKLLTNAIIKVIAHITPLNFHQASWLWSFLARRVASFSALGCVDEPETLRVASFPLLFFNQPPSAWTRAMLSMQKRLVRHSNNESARPFLRISSSTAGRQFAQTGGYLICRDSLYSGKDSSLSSYSGSWKTGLANWQSLQKQKTDVRTSGEGI